MLRLKQKQNPRLFESIDLREIVRYSFNQREHLCESKVNGEVSKGEMGMKLQNRLLGGPFLVTLILLLTSCIPSGNVVGSAWFTTVESNFSDLSNMAFVEVNGGAVATPNGIRLRLNKATFAIPAQGIFLTATRFKDVDPTIFPKSEFFVSRLKGKNTCAFVSGYLNDGQFFIAGFFADPTTKMNYLALAASEGGIYIGQLSSGKLQIGGRNLCGGGA
jgi:hypothetical protein